MQFKLQRNGRDVTLEHAVTRNRLPQAEHIDRPAGVVGAAASLVGVLLSLEIHAARSKAIVHQKQAETRAAMEALESDVKNAMHRLGYNAIVLPVDQSLSDWYADDYAQEVMPEAWCARLEQTDQLVDRTRCRRSFCKNATVSCRLLLPFAYSSSLLRR